MSKIIQKFDTWNDEKKVLNTKQREDFYINPREIWYTKMGVNIGFEEDEKENFLRPVLVLKKVGNLFFTVALTSKGKKNNWFYYNFTAPSFFSKHKKHINDSSAILSQVKAMDKNRFIEKIGFISEEDFFKLQKKTKALLF